MNQKQLEAKIKRLSKDLKKGDSFELMYDGQCIASYEFTEWSIDSKTPLDWLRGCLIFCVSLKGRDIDKVRLNFSKK